MKLSSLILLFFALVVSANSQTLGSPFYKPGDTVRFTVVLDHPAKLEAAAIRIDCIDCKPGEQRGFGTTHWASQYQPVNSNNKEYEISGAIPDSVQSGRYRVALITLKVDGISAQYWFNTDFKSEVIVEIKNPKQTPLPGISDVRTSTQK